jgi:hypothetical protein
MNKSKKFLVKSEVIFILNTIHLNKKARTERAFSMLSFKTTLV